MGDEEDENENKEEEKKDFDFESMKSKIAELLLQSESMEQQLQSTENDLLQFESLANEWDFKHRSTDTQRSKALYAKLNVSNDKLQNELDSVYTKLEKAKAAALTWQNTIEDRLGNDNNDNDEKLILINQLKEENKKLTIELGFNNKADIKGHKA